MVPVLAARRATGLEPGPLGAIIYGRVNVP